EPGDLPMVRRLRDVEWERLDLLDPLGLQLLDGSPTLRPVAAADDHRDAQLAEPPGRLQSDPFVRPGDERDLVLRRHGHWSSRGWIRSSAALTGGRYSHMQVIGKTSSPRRPRRPGRTRRHASAPPSGRPPREERPDPAEPVLNPP